MDVGFDTIGNATAICYDKQPILATDPWLNYDAYFSSWTLGYEIPTEQLEAINKCEYVWISHGHPDHLSSQSLEKLTGKRMLLPDHIGGRVAKDLLEKGFKTIIMKDRVWYQLSNRIKALCIADYNQDAILLIDINGRLIVNLNDASDRGWSHYVRKIIKHYKFSFMLVITGLADSTVSNAFDENGNRLPSLMANRSVGPVAVSKTDFYGAKYFIPFSSFHIHQREDSLWANKDIPNLEEFSQDYHSSKSECLPAYIRYDCKTDQWNKINPAKRTYDILDPEMIGDSWNDCLNASDVTQLIQYFNSVEHLKTYLDYINIRVGGKDHIIELQAKKFNLGVCFEVPRNSLMTCIKYSIFDDLIIGNFMKTSLEGQWTGNQFNEEFIPYVAKYADNGYAKTRSELRNYFYSYSKRAFVDSIKHHLEKQSRKKFQHFIPRDSLIFQTTKKTYYFLKGISH